MANIHVAQRFSALQNFKSILWGETLRYNFVRYATCGFIVAIVSGIIAAKSPGNQSVAGAFFLKLIGFPIVSLFFVVPLAVVTGWVSRIFPPAALFALFLGVFTSIGDPILWFLSLFLGKRPWFRWLVPIEVPPFFSISPLIYLLRPEETTEVFYAGEIPVKDVSGSGFDTRQR